MNDLASTTGHVAGEYITPEGESSLRSFGKPAIFTIKVLTTPQ